MALGAPLRVLLVEDDDGDAFLVGELLEASAAPVELTHVRTLAEAAAAAGAHDCALLDLGLPDATGLDGLRRLRAAASDLAILVLTGRADEDRGIDALAAGAQDYLVKGHVDGQLLARSLRYAVERRRADHARRQLTLARAQAAENVRLERGLLPTPLVADRRVKVTTHYSPGRRRALLGGDFYDVVEAPDGTLHAVIGDVSGHGPDEAAVGVCLRIAWRTLMLAGHPDAELLPMLQAVLEAERHETSIFSTLAAVTISPDRRSLSLRTAGHPAPLLLPAGEPVTHLPSGPPLGVVEGRTWPAMEIALEPGWSVLLFTDGIFEGLRPDGGRLGEAGFSAIVRESRHDLASVVQRAEELNGGPLRDDVALVLVSA